jgi:hypothetical protein
VLAAGCSTTISIEPVYIIGFKISIDAFASRARGTSARSGLHYYERGVVLLRNLRRRQPSLLQRGILAEQRFLQRPSHTLSLRRVKFGPSAQPSYAAVHAAGVARH